MKTELLKIKQNKRNNGQKIKVADDTQFVLNLVGLLDGASYSVDFVFDTPGVIAEVIGLYNLKKDQALDLTTNAIHRVPNTSCFIKIKGVLQDNAQSKYVGKIDISKKAQQTSSFLEDTVLVLGNGTINRSDPILEICANDVKASHGATTGRINKDQIYYLQSRGLSKQEAKKIIVHGFFESLLTQIKDSNIREQLKAQL